MFEEERERDRERGKERGENLPPWYYIILNSHILNELLHSLY